MARLQLRDDTLSLALERARRRPTTRPAPHPARTVGGIVTELGPEHGAVLSADGRRLRFHARDVQEGAFARLRMGAGVAYDEVAGGRVARVRPID
ncbi:MAG TPA: hypothetical protein RMH99_20060 [Sandaracinaceae bacterium LLY-WYZ-13_1]|nr:hypothetical protein [Sandaracinaceae bacterium LLY-WYZ-13_1]